MENNSHNKWKFNLIGTCGIGSSCSALRCSATGNQEAPPPKPQVPALSSCNVMKIWGQITGSYTLRYILNNSRGHYFFL